MKFKTIKVIYEDGLFDIFAETSLESVIDYLKEDDILKEVEKIQLDIN